MTYNATMSNFIWRVVALVLLCIVAPIFLVIAMFILVDDGWPVIYSQKRMGKNKKPFLIWKFRTMKRGSESMKTKYLGLNEADGPVFKIRKDPRFTKFGRVLSWSGLDELPQLFNVIRGEMEIVGPRPLPLDEAKRVDQRYSARYRVLPGITSSWVVSGAHKLSFKEWMELDLSYVQNKSLSLDLVIIFQTFAVLARSIYYSVINK